MAMSKAEQKAASDRIMGKLGPLTGKEVESYELLTKDPENYVPPNGETGERKCGRCGAVFQDQPETKSRVAVSALGQFSDHQAEHNPSPAQWATAHRKIQDSKRPADM